jgi:hypothetical protein
MSQETPNTPSTSSVNLLSKEEIFSTLFEPKMTSRFICYVKDKEDNQFIPSYLLKKIARPVVNRYIENGEGKWRWNPIEIEIYDPVVPSAAQMLVKYIENPVVFDMLVKLLGPVGDIVEKWEFTNVEITSIDFGTLDWCSYPEDGKSKIESVNLTRSVKGGTPATIKATLEYKSVRLVY